MSQQVSASAAVFTLLAKQKERFLSLNKVSGEPLDWHKEMLDARQQIEKNKFTFEVAQRNPASLANAIRNVASIGISLNPASAHAYLVPRDNAICLDISYKGLVKLATDCGAILHCKSVLLHEGDKFGYKGPFEEPEITMDVMAAQRNADNVIGAYNIAKLPGGGVIVDYMTREELEKIKSTSKAKNGPWRNWPEEMMKKAMTKRAFKSWPQTQRLAQAVLVSHEAEGSVYTLDQEAEYHRLIKAEDCLGFAKMRADVSEQTWIALYNSGEKGQKVKLKEKASSLEKAGKQIIVDYSEQFTAAVEDGDLSTAQEIYDDIGDPVLKLAGEQSADKFEILKQEAA